MFYDWLLVMLRPYFRVPLVVELHLYAEELLFDGDFWSDVDSGVSNLVSSVKGSYLRNLRKVTLMVESASSFFPIILRTYKDYHNELAFEDQSTIRSWPR